MRVLEKVSDDFEDERVYLALVAAYELKKLAGMGIMIGRDEATVFDLIMRINEAFGFKHADYKEIDYKLPLAESDVDDAEPNTELKI